MTQVSRHAPLSERMLSHRALSVEASGIRRIYDLGQKIADPVNLSLGQPDFPVDARIKRAAINAIEGDRNGYSITAGVPELHAAIWDHLKSDIGWSREDGLGLVVTNGTSGGLVLASLCLLDAGDEIVIPDPWFVLYPQLAKLAGGAVTVPVDTYPDFRMTASRIEQVLTPRTKMVIVDSPGNPCGVVLSGQELADIADLCARRGIMLVSDEIYDGFVFGDALEGGRCPSPARHSKDMLLIRGFGKTYGATGWRLGYAAGPSWLIAQMIKLQQHIYICAPTPLQCAASEAFHVDLSPVVAEYAARRDMVMDALGDITTIATPHGAFYAFIEVPKRLGMTAQQFCERAVERRLLVVPGGVFSARDTHLRLSFAAPKPKLTEGLAILRELFTRGF
jgi:aspartate/methionine/tyrosine aminotransferase